MHLALGPRIERALHAHARDVWPEEACGAILGLRGPDGSTRARAYRRLENRAMDRGTGFEIDGIELCTVDGDGRDRGLTLLGIFHSHPSGDPSPSARDTQTSWPGLCCWIGAPTADGGFRILAHPLSRSGSIQNRSV